MSKPVDTESVRPLPTNFRQGGFDYVQIQREGKVAIFSQSKGGVILGYEVVKIRVKPSSKFPDGTIIPAREAYPSSEEFGDFGWCCLTLERAKERCDGLREWPN